MKHVLRLTAIITVASGSCIAASHAGAADAFVHPGVAVSKAQLDFAREKVQAGAQPWRGAYDHMLESKDRTLRAESTPT